MFQLPRHPFIPNSNQFSPCGESRCVSFKNYVFIRFYTYLSPPLPPTYPFLFVNHHIISHTVTQCNIPRSVPFLYVDCMFLRGLRSVLLTRPCLAARVFTCLGVFRGDEGPSPPFIRVLTPVLDFTCRSRWCGLQRASLGYFVPHGSAGPNIFLPIFTVPLISTAVPVFFWYV